jgi:predicted nucleotidyltransferase
MINKVRQTLINVCKSLNRQEVDYLLIGGIAVGIQGYPRYTADVDFWYNPTLSNFHKILKALEELGVDITDLTEITFDSKKTFLRIPNFSVRTEFLPQIMGVVSFDEAKKGSTKVLFDEVEVHVLSLSDLIKNKEAVHRPSDLLDVDELKKRNSKQ